jgi:hypothetical protein
MAVKLLVDLRDLYARTNAGDFPVLLRALREHYAKKPAFLRRLNEAGLT